TLATLLLLSAALACTGRKAPETPAPEYRDANSPITTAPGKAFSVVLNANMTTGYQWRLADSLDTRVVSLLGDAYEPYPAAPGVVGSGGVWRWTFQGVAAGTTHIVLGHFPPDGSPPDVQRFTVIVR
ncbi:MAG TPA: protease inhibitor I42 family protein, partial [Longimicrobium sp.]